MRALTDVDREFAERCRQGDVAKEADEIRHEREISRLMFPPADGDWRRGRGSGSKAKRKRTYVRKRDLQPNDERKQSELRFDVYGLSEEIRSFYGRKQPRQAGDPYWRGMQEIARGILTRFARFVLSDPRHHVHEADGRVIGVRFPTGNGGELIARLRRRKQGEATDYAVIGLNPDVYKTLTEYEGAARVALSDYAENEIAKAQTY